jgi:hypothetical protein
MAERRFRPRLRQLTARRYRRPVPPVRGVENTNRNSKGGFMEASRFFAIAAAACSLLAAATPVSAQTAPLEIKVSATDRAAIATASRRFMSATAKRSLASAPGKIRTDIGASGIGFAPPHGGGSATRGPGELTFHGGATIATTIHHAIYLYPNGSVCTAPSCWGSVDQFLSDLGRSSFIHVTDQYVGRADDNRYRVGRALSAHYALPAKPLLDSDMAAVAHAAAAALGGASGYGHIYHVFLAPEQDECFDASYTVCASNYFCAYHSSVVTGDLGEIVYTVEPYAVNVFGCNVRTGTPNGAFDDTYDVLSHEVVETLTDPDGDAWWNSTNSPLFYNEIGDECVFLTFDALGNFAGSDPVVVSLHGRPYAIQSEYSNGAKACAAGAPD